MSKDTSHNSQASKKEPSQPAPKKPSEKKVDESVEMTFPASDPPAVGGATKIKDSSGSEVGHSDKPSKSSH